MALPEEHEEPLRPLAEPSPATIKNNLVIYCEAGDKLDINTTPV